MSSASKVVPFGSPDPPAAGESSESTTQVKVNPFKGGFGGSKGKDLLKKATQAVVADLTAQDVLMKKGKIDIAQLAKAAGQMGVNTRNVHRVKQQASLFEQMEKAKAEHLDLEDGEGKTKKIIKLTQRSKIGGTLVFASGLFAVFLMIGWKPPEHMHGTHSGRLNMYGIPILSPLFTVDPSAPLVLGGVASPKGGHIPLAPGNPHAMLDLKMVLPCTSINSFCMDPIHASHRRRAMGGYSWRDLLSEDSGSDEQEARRLAASGGHGSASTESISWEWWAGKPGAANYRKWHSGSRSLALYSETEVLEEIVPSTYDVGADEQIYLKVMASGSEPRSLLIEVVELTDFGANRVIWSLIVFFIIFVLILSEVINRCFSTLIGVSLVLCLLSIVYHKQEISHTMHHVDYGTILLLMSMMINNHILSLTGFFEFGGARVVALARGEPKVVFVSLAMLAGILSAFLPNVTVVMLLGPVTFSICKSFGVKSVPYYLTQTLTATIGGTMTLVGDPPNVVIGSRLGFPFTDFIKYNGVLVFIILPTSCAIQYWRFKDEIKKAKRMTPDQISDLKKANPIVDEVTLLYVGSLFFCLMLALFLSPVSGIDPHFYVVLMFLAAGLLVDRHGIRPLMNAVEWDTLFFFSCLFIIVEGLVELGLIRAVGKGFVSIITSVPIQSRVTVGCLLILWVSSVGSAFFESLPYTITVCGILNNMKTMGIGIPIAPLGWALSVGACVGGIGSIMGSSANLVALAVSNRLNPDDAIKGSDYLKYGLPVLFVLTVIATVYQYIYFSVLMAPTCVDDSTCIFPAY